MVVMCNSVKQVEVDLRIASVLRGPRVSVVVDGRDIVAYEGETVFAALIAAGIKRLKGAGTDQARGGLCGMGICYECLVTINSVPDQRACMTLVEDQMEIRTHEV